MKQSVTMDAADGSYYKGTMMHYAKDHKVNVRQVSEELYRFTWEGPSWNEIADMENAKFED